jgi:hypothetical protein
MSNPKDKAMQLVAMHINPFSQTGCSHPIHTLFKSTAKQCALNTVDQMISVLPFTDINTSLGKYCESERNYLNEVKQEIEKL